MELKTNEIAANDRVRVVGREWGSNRDVVVETLDGRFQSDYFGASVFRVLLGVAVMGSSARVLESDVELIRKHQSDAEAWLSGGNRAYVKNKLEHSQ